MGEKRARLKRKMIVIQTTLMDEVHDFIDKFFVSLKRASLEEPAINYQTRKFVHRRVPTLRRPTRKYSLYNIFYPFGIAFCLLIIWGNLAHAEINEAYQKDFDTPYTSEQASEPLEVTRLQMIDYIARHFSIGSSVIDPNDRGYWGGIYLQTKWQSERKMFSDSLVIWNYINASLTVNPYHYAIEFMADRRNGVTGNDLINCSESLYAKDRKTREPRSGEHAEYQELVDNGQFYNQIDVCQAWKKVYLEASTINEAYTNGEIDEKEYQSRSLKSKDLLWQAHTAAIFHHLWQFKREFKEADIPAPEKLFWAGWIEYVESLAGENFTGVSFPTTETITEPFQVILPYCGPVGAPECQVADLPILQRRYSCYVIQKGAGYGGVEAFVNKGDYDFCDNIEE